MFQDTHGVFESVQGLTHPLRMLLLVPEILDQLKLVLWSADSVGTAQIQDAIQQVGIDGPNVVIKGTLGLDFSDSALPVDHRQWSLNQKLEAAWIILAANSFDVGCNDIGLNLKHDDAGFRFSDEGGDFMKACREVQKQLSDVLRGATTVQALASALLDKIMAKLDDSKVIDKIGITNEERKHVVVWIKHHWVHETVAYAAFKRGHVLCEVYNILDALDYYFTNGRTLKEEGVTFDGETGMETTPHCGEIFPY
ncbi:MAG: hypothetical protein A2563_01085 [Candidatus Magasanikbacteria bacterium RIFOXYD1_FULL_40_23]|uniref:Uncharacterized protein n=1 Tax=Candidatus Magasanikbacteria bacterium RIFOXYD1_FULL_40_23 TaxID=1798705 RepID=A0A1F6PAJ0_9BACT|nr:MAG: hypothetical protein A2563_01085 [Candidatus Magasanikbacteria bacterium RIFOXYD1_FULL_40_23]